LLDQFSTRKTEPAPNPRVEKPNEQPNGENSNGAPTPVPPARVNNDGVKQPVPPRPLDVKEVPRFRDEKPTLAGLAKFLDQNKGAEEIILELDDLDLQHARDDRQPDLVITNPIVTIRPRTRDKRPTVRDSYHGQIPHGVQASFTIQSQTCTIEDIR